MPEVDQVFNPNFKGRRSDFEMYNSDYMPSSIQEAFELSEYLYYQIGIYRQAINRVVSYFITEAAVKGADMEKERRWETTLNDKMNLMGVARDIGIEFFNYGNSVTSLVFPFRRYLVCPKDDCHSMVRIERVPVSFSEGSFQSRCPKCGHEGKMKVHDRRLWESDDIHVIRWSLDELEIEYNPISGDERVRWDTSSWKDKVDNSNRTVLETTPLGMLKAIEGEKELLLNDNLVKHLKHNSLSGVDAGPWGIPPVVSCFGDVYYYQLLRKYQETIAADEIYPINVLTPAAVGNTENSSSQDLLGVGGDMGYPMVMDKIEQMLEEHEQDPTAWHTSPFPIQQGTIGGNISMLQPKLLEHSSTELLNAMGVPSEFYRLNMRWKPSPEAIRIVEKSWEFLTSALDSWLCWMTDIISMSRGWPSVDAHLKPPSMYDDPVRKQMLLQLASQGEASMSDAFAELGLDYKEQRRKVKEEKEYMKKEQMDQEMEEMTRLPPLAVPQQPTQGGAGGGGGGAGGGAGGGGPAGMPPAGVGMPSTYGGGAPMTVSDMSQQAEQIASEVIQMPYPQRRSMLEDIKSQNKDLHALVKSQMKSFRSDVDQQGAMQARQQTFGAV